jgi:UDPglucose 6-dehydrogenase
VRRLYGDRLSYSDQPYAALEGADVLAIMTEWKEFLQPDFAQMRTLMAKPVIFDGRNLYSPSLMKAAGFTYHSIGRASVG